MNFCALFVDLGQQDSIKNIKKPVDKLYFGCVLIFYEQHS